MIKNAVLHMYIHTYIYYSSNFILANNNNNSHQLGLQPDAQCSKNGKIVQYQMFVRLIISNANANIKVF